MSSHVLMSAAIARMDSLLSLVTLELRGGRPWRFPILGGAIVAAAATVHITAVYFTLPYAPYHVIGR